MDWQPIETAPKNDVIVLTDGGWLMSGFWNHHCWMTGFSHGDLTVTVKIHPTHWAPLPDKPKETPDHGSS